MKRILLGLIAMVSVNAHAGTFQFNLWEASIEEFQPFKVTVNTGNSLNDIQTVTIKDANKNITLFKINKSLLNIKASKNQIAISQKTSGLRPFNKTTYHNAYGDTPIDPKNTYAVDIKLDLRNGQFVGGNIEIADNQVEEMALWGDLLPSL